MCTVPNKDEDKDFIPPSPLQVCTPFKTNRKYCLYRHENSWKHWKHASGTKKAKLRKKLYHPIIDLCVIVVYAYDNHHKRL